MKRFLKNMFLFTLPIILLAYPLDILISTQLKKSNTYAEGEYSIWNDLYNGKINSDIVIYGSSRAWVHINPELFEKGFGFATYNLGIDGHNFWLQYFRHKTLLKYNRKPKFIVVSIDVFSLQKRKDLYNAKQFLPYMLFNDELKNFINSYKGYSSVDYYVPLIRYSGKTEAIKSTINNLLFDNPNLGRKKGFQGMERTWSNALYKTKTKMKYYEAKLDDNSIKLFDNFLKECDVSDIRVILVYTPEYIEGQNFVKNRNEIISLFENFSEKYRIPFLDYSSNKICTKKEYFYNASHLNKIGAELFTNMLINDLKEKDIIISPN